MCKYCHHHCGNNSRLDAFDSALMRSDASRIGTHVTFWEPSLKPCRGEREGIELANQLWAAPTLEFKSKVRPAMSGFGRSATDLPRHRPTHLPLALDKRTTRAPVELIEAAR
jgi:hypothetical protein